jgi:hypothetical protein
MNCGLGVTDVGRVATIIRTQLDADGRIKRLFINEEDVVGTDLQPKPACRVLAEKPQCRFRTSFEDVKDPEVIIYTHVRVEPNDLLAPF